MIRGKLKFSSASNKERNNEQQRKYRYSYNGVEGAVTMKRTVDGDPRTLSRGKKMLTTSRDDAF